MMKNVLPGERVTTVTLDGSECAVKFSRPFKAFSVQNDGNADICIALESGKSKGDDGVLSISPGASDTYFHGRQLDTCYLLGTAGGKATVKAQNTDTNTFEYGGGGNGGGGEENTIEKIKVNGTALPIESDKSVDIPVPTKNSQLQNDSDFATKTYVGEQIADIDKLTRSIVEELPTDEEAQENVIYMIMVADISGNDKYQEYLKINGTLQMIGDTSVDLTDYVKSSDLDAAIGQKADKTALTALETSVNAELNTKVDKDNIPAATAQKVGGIKPDDVTVSVDGNGVLSAQKTISSAEIAFLKSQIPERNLITTEVWDNVDFVGWGIATGQTITLPYTRDSFWSIVDIGAYPTTEILAMVHMTLSEGAYTNTVLVKTDIPYSELIKADFRYIRNNQWFSSRISQVTVIDPKNKIYKLLFNYTTTGGNTVYAAFNLYPPDSTPFSGTYIAVSHPCLEKTDSPSWYFPTGYYTTQKSNAKLAVQIAHPNNYLIYDDLDKPSTMVAIPKFYLDEVISGAEHIVHPAFLVNGVEQNTIYISKYQNIVENDRAYSLPMKDPAVNINFDRSWTCCKNKGQSWHLMTAAEWAAVALWCKKNGTIPKGNNNYGKDISETVLPQKAIAASVGSDGKINRVLTGSGRENWYHDGTYAGIADLNGNVWEWIGDIRLVYGELQVIPNAASGECDTSANSADWKAINASATSYDDLFIIPNGSGTTANSVKLDWVDNHWQWQNTALESTMPQGRGATFATTTYSSLSDFCRNYLQSLALGPDDGATADDYGGDYFHAINGEVECCTIRGGDWYGDAGTGVFSLKFSVFRSNLSGNVGCRSAYKNASAQPLMTLELTDEDYISEEEFLW